MTEFLGKQFDRVYAEKDFSINVAIFVAGLVGMSCYLLLHDYVLTLYHDFVIVKRVYDNDKIEIGVFIKPAMNNRAASEKGVNSRIRLKFKFELLCKTSV